MRYLIIMLLGGWGSLCAQPTWVDSGAPIGDTSVYVYPVSWAGQSLSINLNSEDTARVSNFSGAGLAGFHLYRVQSAPNYTTGLMGGSIRNNVYWGVFPVGNVAAGYDVSIHYGTNSNLTLLNEPTITVYGRERNDITAWDELGSTRDETNDNITFSHTGRQEFILDSVVILPVERLRLSARLLPDARVALQWRTETETHSAYFELQRSTDGRVFDPVHQLAAAGYSTRPNTYAYTDAVETTGRLYYRLRQVDLDGTAAYSNLATVLHAPAAQVQVFPSPLTDRLLVSVALQEETVVQIALIDALGREVLRREATLAPGEVFQLNTEGLRAGIYHLRIGSPQVPPYTRQVVKLDQ
ncbi:MAG: T9SS type A sorting domain-containing protein [Bacteroidetes bacterium]|nr:T9SS type A sorting domain-containing protein [Bacteroidota bacterium]